MIKLFRVSLVLLAAGQLSACAVMSKTDCMDADWQGQGYKVGKSGDPDIAAAFNKREKLCARYNVSANWQDFESGYSEGVDEYCDVSNAVKHGIRGASRSLETCPESEYFGFYQAFTAGYKLFELKEAVRQADYELGRIESSIYSYQSERENIRIRLNSGDLTEDERRYARSRLRRLSREISYLRSSIYASQNRLFERQRAADKYSNYLKSEYNDDPYDGLLSD